MNTVKVGMLYLYTCSVYSPAYGVLLAGSQHVEKGADGRATIVATCFEKVKEAFQMYRKHEFKNLLTGKKKIRGRHFC